MSGQIPTNIKEACKNHFYAEALEQLVENASRQDVIDDLRAQDIPEEEARAVVKESVDLLEKARAGVGAPYIFGGILSLAFGLGITLVTYAAAMEAGGSVLICYGAVIWGLFAISRGLRLKNFNARGILRNQIQDAIKEATASSDFANAGQQEQRGTGSRGRYDY